VLVACNGQEALNILAARAVDLVLMDLQMPVMDGFRATVEIRRQEAAAGNKRHLPIIALSAAVMDDDRARAAEAGVDGHLAKPIDETALYRIIADHLGPKILAGAEGTAPTVNTTEEGFPVLIGFDSLQGKAAAQGDRSFYLKLLGVLYEQLVGNFADLPESILTNSLQQTQRRVHTLRGMAATVGATLIADSATAIDISCSREIVPSKAMIGELANAITSACSQIVGLLPVAREFKPVDEGAGRKAISTMLVILQNNQLLDDDLFDTVLNAIAAKLGTKSAVKLRSMVEQSDMAGAVQLLAAYEQQMS
jgi:CheY-like chemotaxis protein